MRTIHKFEIRPGKEAQTLDLPQDLRFLHVEYLTAQRAIFMWVEVPADITQKGAPRRFRVFSSGDGIPDSAVHVGSCVDQYLPESYHVYELCD